MKILALKICIDSARGYREGVPRILDALDDVGAFGSFFFGMGTEDDGSMMSKVRFFREEREIVGGAPGIIRDAHRRGHDCGLYGWRPREWQNRLDKIKDTTLVADMKRSKDLFFRRTGEMPKGFAAPGFRVNYMSLRIQDDAHFEYCSDTFGFCPFFPKISWKTFSTPQIPSTLPPLEVAMKGAGGQSARALLEELRRALPEGLSVLPMNAETCVESDIMDPMAEFIARCVDTGARLITLERVINSLARAMLPRCEITSAAAFGMPREVAMQVID